MAVITEFLLQWIIYPSIILFLIRWIDKKLLNNIISFNFKFLVFYGLVSVTAIFVIPLFILFDRGDCVNSRRVSALLRQYSYVIGVKWEVRGIDIMSQDVGCVIVANHQSSLDILGMFWIWRYFGRMAAIAKKEIFYVWPFGLAAYFAGVVFIDRSNASKAKEQLQETSRMMSTDRTKLLIFPEGTRNKGGQDMLPFKKGAFHMAISCQAPIMPIVYSPYFFINSDKRYFGSGRVVITALPMIPTKGLTLKDVDFLKEKVREIMLKNYREVSEEMLATGEFDEICKSTWKKKD